MKRTEKLKVLKEIDKVDKEKNKYYLGEGYHRFIRYLKDDPKVWWQDLGEKKIKVSESEIKKYSRHSNLFKITVVD